MLVTEKELSVYFLAAGLSLRVKTELGGIFRLLFQFLFRLLSWFPCN